MRDGYCWKQLSVSFMFLYFVSREIFSEYLFKNAYIMNKVYFEAFEDKYSVFIQNRGQVYLFQDDKPVSPSWEVCLWLL